MQEALLTEAQVQDQVAPDQVTMVEVIMAVTVIPDQIQDQVQVVLNYHTQPHKVLLMVLLQNQDAMPEEDTTLEDTGTLQSTMKTEMQ